jgi:stringent starvation protein B
MKMQNMTPRRPYLLRAFYEWLVDNELTPHLVVAADLPGVRVPLEFVQDGQIVLNVAPRAVGNLEMGNEALSFHARFGGRPHSVIVPIYAVQAIYARENGAGTMFDPEEAYEDLMEQASFADEQEVSLTSIESSKPSLSDSDDEPTPPSSSRGRPSLKIVK